jgi:micrococcal nuclease
MKNIKLAATAAATALVLMSCGGDGTAGAELREESPPKAEDEPEVEEDDDDLAAREAEAAAAAEAEELAEARAAAELAEAAEAEEQALKAAEEAAAAALWTVFNVVDGDTVDVRARDGTEERIRVVGIDTPERGECGFGPATSAMSALVLDQEVQLGEGAQDDRDRYGRLLRYVDVDSVDAGLTLIEDGLAIARYDSRDGYGEHARESVYVAEDEVSENYTCAAPEPEPTPTPAPEAEAEAEAEAPASVYYQNCTAARDAGAAPVRRGDPGYASHLDRDNDGIGCE